LGVRCDSQSKVQGATVRVTAPQRDTDSESQLQREIQTLREKDYTAVETQSTKPKPNSTFPGVEKAADSTFTGVEKAINPSAALTT